MLVIRFLMIILFFWGFEDMIFFKVSPFEFYKISKLIFLNVRSQLGMIIVHN